MNTYISVIATLTMLASCSDSGKSDQDGDGSISPEEMAAEASSGPDVAMRAGEWEQTFEISDMQFPGMTPEMKSMVGNMTKSSFTVTTCLSEEDVAEPDADFFTMDDQDNCEFQEFDRSGNRMAMRMTCDAEEGGKSSISMDGEFSEDAYSLQFENLTTGTPMGDMSMKGRMNARRLGDC